MMEFVVSRFQRPAETAAEILQVHQMAQEFRQEVEYRDQFEAYCAWYDQTARQHQQEWAEMQNDPHLLSWFWGHSDKTA